MRGYTDEQVRWLEEHAHLYTRDELAAAFNAEFGTNKSGEAIRSIGKRLKWPYRRAENWAKGLSRDEFKAHFTEEAMQRRTAHFAKYCKAFKAGEIFERNGELYIVTSDKDHCHITERSMQYDRYLYEQAYGVKLRKQDLLFHVDGNEMNNDIDNLMVLPVEMLVTYSRWLASPEGKQVPEINRACLMVCQLEHELRKQDQIKEET